MLSEKVAWVQPLPKVSTYCLTIRVQCFPNSGVCHVMKVVIAESNPDMELLTQHFASAQTFWPEQLDASDDNVNSLCQ